MYRVPTLVKLTICHLSQSMLSIMCLRLATMIGMTVCECST